MNKAQKIAMIRQLISGADLSESRCYILEVGEALPPDYRRNTDTVIWVTDDKGDVKKPTGKNDILVQVTSKETVQAVKKLGDYCDNVSDNKLTQTKQPEPTNQQTAEKIKSWLPMEAPAPIEPAAIPPAAIPMQPRTIPNPRAGYRRTHI
jgi:hypothetical protein